MAAIDPLDRYRRYLESIDQEAPEPSDDEGYFELLAPGEAVDLLCVRDELAAQPLGPSQRRELRRLDALLRKHCRLVAGNVVPPPGRTRSSWWWFLARPVESATGTN